ncbi:MAG TPA: T9SS type A sorting domain-containing protein [Bacteroidia bacterium]|nr:T9SS type A sorting domain-containing protein [Bacteroidia bacterium]
MAKLRIDIRLRQTILNSILTGCLLISVNCFGQGIKRQTIASSVGSNSVDGINVSQTIGQPYQTQSTQSGAMTYHPGFQQPHFSTELITATINVRVVPNPALLSFFIECSDTLVNAVLTSYDESGRLIFTEEIEMFKKHEVQCAGWANGVYMITVTDRKNNLVTAKLIKTQ